jgi:hypothetical protein
VTEQGYPPRRPDRSARQGGAPGRTGRARGGREPSRTSWQLLDAFDAGAESENDPPPWAGPGIEPIRPGRWPGRTPTAEPDDEAEPDDLPPADEPVRRRRLTGRSRAAKARRRRSRRRLVTWGGAAAAIVVIAGVVIYLTRPTPVQSTFVTALQNGEFRSVPNACRVIGAADLSQYLAGTPKSYQANDFAAQSECTYTVDAKPVFRVLDASMQAYQPAAFIGTGNGSATAYAMFSYSSKREQLIKPPKDSPEPPATITPIAGLGQVALGAVQVFHVGAVTDRVTVLVRYHNVLITAYMEAQVSGGFGPVTISDLRAGALAAARQLLAAVQAQSAVG